MIASEHFPISAVTSLIVIAIVLGVTIAASLVFRRRDVNAKAL
jgi:hypothetical protein